MLRSLAAVLLVAVVVLFGVGYGRRVERSASRGHAVARTVQTASVVRASASGGSAGAPADHFGWLTFLAKPLYLALRFVHDHGVGNWGWSIVTLTVLFNLLLIWPRVLALRSSLKMMRVQPQVNAIKGRYAHLKFSDPKRTEMNAEMAALYKAEEVNTFGGCMPMLLQMPLLFAYLKVLRNASELHHAHWLWLMDLTLPDPLHVLPLLIIVSMVLTQMITPTPGITGAQRWMMALLMPVVMGFSLWHYASGMSLYWVTGNLINLLIQLVINRSEMGREMLALAGARAKGAPEVEGKLA
ncbi:MAG: membrane protein insertase YidC [Acidobacteriaceae bacterium]